MKNTGMIKKVDDLGRIVIPIEMRRHFNINIGDELELFLHDEDIVLRRLNISCIVCDSHENPATYNNKTICSKCIKKLDKKYNA